MTVDSVQVSAVAGAGDSWFVHWESNRTGATGRIDYPFSEATAQFVADACNKRMPVEDQWHHWIEQGALRDC